MRLAITPCNLRDSPERARGTGARSGDRASLPGVNPLQKARDGAGSAWAGTKRTAGWDQADVAGASVKVRTGATNLRGAAQAHVDEHGGGPGWPGRDLGPRRRRLAGAPREAPTAASAPRVIIGAILFVLWIAWTVYVWTENGTAAGLGVLISWPAVLAVLALVAAPFVGAVVLVRRLAANGGPTLAVAGGGTTEPHATDGEDVRGGL